LTDFEHFRQALTAVNEDTFESLALEIFHFQAQNNPLYQKYLSLLGCPAGSITQLTSVPFIPVEFFKHHRVQTGNQPPEIIYTSSGTTSSVVSRHYVPDRDFYLSHARTIFEAKYGPLSGYHIFGLLPSYLEREGSSLIDMVEYFLRVSDSNLGGLYLDDHKALSKAISEASQLQDRTILLLGVSFALLDLAEAGGIPSAHDLIVMETGGMKGRRKEMIRDELHEILCNAFDVDQIHSEYGMTELMSQAYSEGHGIFSMPPSMKIYLRDPNDPFDFSVNRLHGGINIVDLGNFSSCSFIQTSDIGEKTEEGYRILGRMDNSDIRGCNLLIQSAL
jgi:hypothetical protein